MQRCAIVGGGGHAKVVIEILRLEGRYLPCAITDADASRWGQRVSGVPIVGGDAGLCNLLHDNVRHFVVGTGSVGDNRLRKRLFDLACESGLQPATAVHPAATASESARIGRGTVLMAGAIVNADAAIGDNVVINSGAIVEHDCRISDHVYLSPGVCLASAIAVGPGAFVGIGAAVKQLVQIGAWAVVGAGSVVLKDVPPQTTVVGVPARAVRT